MTINKPYFLFWYLATIWGCLPGTCPDVAASQVLTITPDLQYEFAETLFQNRQYRRSAEEFQRFVFFFPDDARRRGAAFQAAEAFRLAGDLSAAIKAYQAIIRGADDHSDVETTASYFMLAECYLQLRAFSQALLQLHNLQMLSDDPQVHDRVNYRRGWIAADQGDWEGANRAWGRISSHSAFPRDDLVAALNDAQTIPRKSPALAGTLSIVPGMGQLYLGRGQDALVALVIAGGSIWASWEAYDNDLPALGTLLALVGTGFYAGNVYGAVSGAHKFNQLQIDGFSHDLRRRFDAPHLKGPKEGAGLYLQLKITF